MYFYVWTLLKTVLCQPSRKKCGALRKIKIVGLYGQKNHEVFISLFNNFLCVIRELRINVSVCKVEGKNIRAADSLGVAGIDRRPAR